MAAFNLRQIANLTCTDELDLYSIGEKKAALFCCIPDADTSLNYLVENEKKRIFRFEFPAFQQRKKFGSHAGRITGSLIALLFSFRWLHFREAVFCGEVVRTIHPNAREEIIESADTRGIPERETTEDGINGRFPEHAASGSDGSHFQFQSKQIGAQHTGREPWFRAKNRVTA